MSHFLIISTENAVFQIRGSSTKSSENTIFLSLAMKRQCHSLKWAQNDSKDLLIVECLIGTKFQLCYLSRMEKTRDYDSMDGAHGMNSASKMSAVVNKWICARAVIMREGYTSTVNEESSCNSDVRSFLRSEVESSLTFMTRRNCGGRQIFVRHGGWWKGVVSLMKPL